MHYSTPPVTHAALVALGDRIAVGRSGRRVHSNSDQPTYDSPPTNPSLPAVTKLDPAALRHGTRLRCGGGKHQSKVSEIYYRHKTVFMDGPTSRSVPCNWPPPGHVTLSHTYISPNQRRKRTRGTRRR